MGIFVKSTIDSFTLVHECLFLSFSAGEDYEALDVNVTFPIGSRNGSVSCAEIPLMDDECFEKKERFYLHLYAVERNIHVYGSSYVDVWILDEDGKSGMCTITARDIDRQD